VDSVTLAPIRPWVAVAVLAVGVVGVAATSLFVGEASLSDADLRGTLLSLRASRVVAAAIAGAALAVAGVMVQGLFRNPLASPSVLGTTAGAAFGGRVAMVVAEIAGGSAWLATSVLLPLGCLLGALVALSVLLLIARLKDDIVVLLLTGFLLSSLFVSLGGLVMSLSQEHWELVRAMVGFSLGDVSSAGPEQVALAVPLVLAGTVAAWRWAGSLDLLLTGEDEAAVLGLDIVAVRVWCVVWSAILTAAAVAVGGTVSLVWLAAPH
jgi:iron complex transport system permease protein